MKLDREMVAPVVFSVNASEKIGIWAGRRKPSRWLYSGRGCNVSSAMLSDINESTQNSKGNLDL